MSFPAYDEYKDSGVEWLGEVPAYWDIRRLKFVSDIQTGDKDTVDAVEDGEFPFFVRSQTVERIGTTTFDCEAVLTAGDGVGVGKVFHYHKGPFDFHQRVYMMNNFRDVDGRFLFHYLKSNFYKVALEGGAKSTVDSIRRPMLSDFPVTFPPCKEEQKAIASFLDTETSKIDDLVAEQRRLIELLKEKRQAVISHAVTKGLKPDVPMKPSGIEWLGDVPEHWNVLELRRLIKPGTSITYGIVQAGPDIEGGIPYIRTSDMSGNDLPESGYLRTTTQIDQSYARSKVCPGDLVVAIRATLGKGLLVPDFLDGANLTQGTAKVSPGDKLTSRFLYWAFNSAYCQLSIDHVAKGTTFREITLGALRRIRLVVPAIEEQAEIVAYLDDRIGRFNTLQAEAERAIELLQERRTALISAAVTGKIDVRGFACQETA